MTTADAMDASGKPETFGVFKPVGHVIVAFPDAQAARDAESALAGNGFSAADIVAYTPEQMIRQADGDIANAGVLASIGQELNLVKAHRELAQKGHSFLVVAAAEDDRALAGGRHRPRLRGGPCAEIRPLHHRGADRTRLGRKTGGRIARSRTRCADDVRA